MSRSLIVAAGALLTFCVAGEAAASCQPRLQAVAQRVSELPAQSSGTLHDHLNELYDEALALEEVEPARCLAVVIQMEALLAGRGAAGSSGGAGAGSATGEQRAGGRATIETQGARRVAETPVLPVPPVQQRGFEVRGPNAFTQSVVNYWTASSVHERGLLLGAGTAYIEELREIAEEVIAEEEDEGARRRKALAASQAIHAVELYQHVVLVNEPEDVLAARQMDALYRLRQSTRRALVRWARDEQMKEDDDFLAPLEPNTNSDDFLAPLVRDDFLAPLVRPSSDSAGGDDGFLAPLVRPEDPGFMARVVRRVSLAEARLQQVRADVAYWIEDRMID